LTIVHDSKRMERPFAHRLRASSSSLVKRICMIQEGRVGKRIASILARAIVGPADKNDATNLVMWLRASDC